MMTVADLTIPPDAIFGMLLAQEGGASLDQMSHVYGLSKDRLSGLLTLARRGECGKVEASTGDARVPMGKNVRNAGPIASDKQEVLVQRWMRRIARHLHRHGEIGCDTLRDLLGGPDSSASLEVLRNQLAKLGVHLVGTARRGHLPLVVELDAASQQRLAAIIAADWKIEVER